MKCLFSCESTGPLAHNREAMWQETNSNFQSGAFGDPSQLDTLVLFWKKMEMLHYPGAGETRSYLEQKSLEEQAVPQLMPVQDAGLAPQAVSQVAPQADMPFNM